MLGCFFSSFSLAVVVSISVVAIYSGLFHFLFCCCLVTFVFCLFLCFCVSFLSLLLFLCRLCCECPCLPSYVMFSIAVLSCGLFWWNVLGQKWLASSKLGKQSLAVTTRGASFWRSVSFSLKPVGAKTLWNRGFSFKRAKVGSNLD